MGELRRKRDQCHRWARRPPDHRGPPAPAHVLAAELVAALPPALRSSSSPRADRGHATRRRRGPAGDVAGGLVGGDRRAHPGSRRRCARSACAWSRAAARATTASGCGGCRSTRPPKSPPASRRWARRRRPPAHKMQGWDRPHRPHRPPTSKRPAQRARTRATGCGRLRGRLPRAPRNRPHTRRGRIETGRATVPRPSDSTGAEIPGQAKCADGPALSPCREEGRERHPRLSSHRPQRRADAAHRSSQVIHWRLASHCGPGLAGPILKPPMECARTRPAAVRDQAGWAWQVASRRVRRRRG